MKILKLEHFKQDPIAAIFGLICGIVASALFWVCTSWIDPTWDIFLVWLSKKLRG